MKSIPSAPRFSDVSIEVNRVVGPRSVHGAVSLEFQASDNFIFVSEVDWPNGDDYSAYVREGVEEGICRAGGNLLPCKVTLTAIKFHPVNSCASGFKTAALSATLAAFEANI
jgi:hypothetical protein